MDAIQGLGVYPVDVRALGIAALAAEGRKWLWAPPGSGFLYVDPERLGAIRPATAGAQSVRNFDDFLQWVALVDAEGRLDLGGLYREGAGRFESGFPNVACVAGLGAALELGDRIGRDAIRNTVDRLVARLVAGLAERGWPVHGPVAAEERSGIVSFEVPGDAERAFHALNAAGCTLGLRDGRLRAAPHAYNTADEVDRLLDLLDGLVAGA